jgi:hypothetical protein
MTHRQPKLPLALRIIAAGCIVLWLAGVSACSLEALVGCESHQHASAAHSDHADSHDVAAADSEGHHEHDRAHHSDDAEHHRAADGEGDSHGSHKHDGKEGSCCSTLKAVVQSAKSITIPKQILQPLALLCVLIDARTFVLDARDTASDRPPWRGEWVFTPEVCTGPANRSHAPPSLHLI